MKKDVPAWCDPSLDADWTMEKHKRPPVLVEGFLDNRPARLEALTGMAVVERTGERVLVTKPGVMFMEDEVFWVDGVGYYRKAAGGCFVRIGKTCEKVSAEGMKQRLQEGAVMEKLVGEAFRKAMVREMAKGEVDE